MESLAYLYLIQENESAEIRDLHLDELAHLSRKAMMVGALSLACAVGVSMAEKAEAYPCYGYSASSYYGYSPYSSYYPASYYNYSPYYNYYGYNYYPYSNYNNYYGYNVYDPTPYYDYYSYNYYPVYDPTPYYDYYSYDYYPVYDPTPYYDYHSYYNSYFRDWYAIYYPVSPADDAQAEAMTDQIYKDYVTGIQTKLTESGYYTAAIDGIYGEATASAVAVYQADQGLTADGIVGPETGKSLGLGWSY